MYGTHFSFEDARAFQLNRRCVDMVCISEVSLCLRIIRKHAVVIDVLRIFVCNTVTVLFYDA
jgi:hypothetical protein